MILDTEQTLRLAGFEIAVPLEQLTQGDFDRLGCIAMLGLPTLRAWHVGLRNGIAPMRSDQLGKVRDLATALQIPFPPLAAAFGYIYRPEYDLFVHARIWQPHRAHVRFDEFCGLVLWSEFAGAENIRAKVTVDAGPR